MLRKKTMERIKRFENEQFKIRFVKNTDENPQKEETTVTKNNGVVNNGKK